MESKETYISKIGKYIAKTDVSICEYIQRLDTGTDLIRYMPTIILVHKVPDNIKNDYIREAENKFKDYYSKILSYCYVYGNDAEFNGLFNNIINNLDSVALSNTAISNYDSFINIHLMLHAKINASIEQMPYMWHKYENPLSEKLLSYKQDYIKRNGLIRPGYELEEEPFGTVLNDVFAVTAECIRLNGIALREKSEILWQRIIMLSPNAQPLDINSKEVETSIKHDINSIHTSATPQLTDSYHPTVQPVNDTKREKEVKSPSITSEMISMKYALMTTYAGWEPESARVEFFTKIAPQRNANSQYMYQMYREFTVPYAREKKIKVMSKVIESGLLDEFPLVKQKVIEEVRTIKAKGKLK